MDGAYLLSVIAGSKYAWVKQIKIEVLFLNHLPYFIIHANVSIRLIEAFS